MMMHNTPFHCGSRSILLLLSILLYHSQDSLLRFPLSTGKDLCRGQQKNFSRSEIAVYMSVRNRSFAPPDTTLVTSKPICNT